MNTSLTKTKAPATNFVIMEMADNYNDEVYSLQDYGTPVQVIYDLVEAEAECNRRQYKKLRGLQIGAYAYDCSELTYDRTEDYRTRDKGLAEEEVCELLPFCNFPSDDFNEWTIPDDLTDQQLAKVCEVFKGLRFFTVVSV